MSVALGNLMIALGNLMLAEPNNNNNNNNDNNLNNTIDPNNNRPGNQDGFEDAQEGNPIIPAPIADVNDAPGANDADGPAPGLLANNEEVIRLMAAINWTQLGQRHNLLRRFFRNAINNLDSYYNNRGADVLVRDLSFLKSINTRTQPLSERQAQWVRDIVGKVHRVVAVRNFANEV